MLSNFLLWPQNTPLLKLEALNALGGKVRRLNEQIELGLYWIIGITGLVLAIENLFFSNQIPAGIRSLIIFAVGAWQLFAHRFAPKLKMPLVMAMLAVAGVQLYQVTQRGLIPAMHFTTFAFLCYALLGIRTAFGMSVLQLLAIFSLLKFMPVGTDPTLVYRYIFSEFTTLLMVHTFSCITVFLLNRLHEESKAKSRFLDSVSHELRTPLNGIAGLAFCLRQEPQNSTDKTNYLDKLDMAVEHLSGIIGDVLDLSRLEKSRMVLQMKPANLVKLTQDVLSMLGDSALHKQITIGLQNSKDLPKLVLTDHQRLRQILFNYLSNALKFTHQGSVELHTFVLDRNEKAVRIRFLVKDTGVGIPVNAQARLFNIFEQAHTNEKENYGGSGLGLSIVKGLTEVMGGQVGFRSTVAQGSEFWADIPFQITYATEETDQQPIHKNFLESLNILIVDDAPLNILVAENVLKHYGARCLSANDGEESLKVLRAHHDIDLVLMDMRMPVMDGLAATKAIRADALICHIPIIGLTGAAMLEDRNKALEAGMNDLITKPFNRTDLLNKIKLYTQVKSTHNA